MNQNENILTVAFYILHGQYKKSYKIEMQELLKHSRYKLHHFGI